MQHLIRYAFTDSGDFIAVDETTKAACCGYRTSIYASRAFRDPVATARDMIRDSIKERSCTSPAIWDWHYGHLLARIADRAQELAISDDETL